MKNAFEKIKPDDIRKAEVLEEILKYNREHGRAKAVTEESIYKGDINMIKDNDITNKRELSPNKNGKKNALIKGLLAAAMFAVVIGSVMIVRSARNDKNVQENNAASEGMSEEQTTIIEDGVVRKSLYLRDIKYNEGEDFITIMASNDKESTAEAYSIRVEVQQVYKKNGQSLESKEVLEYKSKKGTEIIVYFNGRIMESYPAQITANEVVIMQEGTDASEGLTNINNQMLGISLYYDENTFEYSYDDRDGCMNFKAKEYTSIPNEVDIYTLEREFMEVVEDIREMDGEITHYIESTEIGCFIESTSIGICEYIDEIKSNRHTIYRVINGDDYYDDGSVYIVKSVSYDENNNDGIIETADMFNTLKFITKNGKEPSEEPIRDVMICENGNISGMLWSKGIYQLIWQDNGVEITRDLDYNYIWENIAPVISNVVFKEVEKEVPENTKSVTLRIMQTQETTIEITAYDNGLIKITYASVEICGTADKDIYELFEAETKYTTYEVETGNINN